MFRYLTIDKCRLCKEIIPDNGDGPATLCAGCLQHVACDPLVETIGGDASGREMVVVSGFVYDGPIRDMVLGLKYRNQRIYAEDMAVLIQPAWWTLAEHLSGTPFVVPVPLHWTRKLYRGFNQAELIANALCWRLGLLEKRFILTRERRTKPHHGLTRVERMENVDCAFSARIPKTPVTIVLLDDVLTSGATLMQCAQALRNAGWAQVAALCVARATEESDTKNCYGQPTIVESE